MYVSTSISAKLALFDIHKYIKKRFATTNFYQILNSKVQEIYPDVYYIMIAYH